jgi:hypothetical protein
MRRAARAQSTLFLKGTTMLCLLPLLFLPLMFFATVPCWWEPAPRCHDQYYHYYCHPPVQRVADGAKPVSQPPRT